MSELQATQVRVSHRTDSSLFYETSLKAKSLSLPGRLLNASKYLGICWLAAAAFIFVPVLHFFLVPLAFLAGVVFFFQKLRLGEYLETSTIRCPSCKTELTLKSRAFNWPVREMCTNCRTDIVIDQTP